MGQAFSSSHAKWCSIDEMCEIDTLRGPLGNGAFAIVWRARDKKAGGSIVALKVQDKQQMESLGVTEEHVESEAALMSECVGFDWFVQVQGFFQDSHAYYLVLEFCGSGTLASAVKDGRALGDEQVSLFMNQLLHGVSFLHDRKICHRDVKPQNAMLATTRNALGQIETSVKLGDFGLAVRFEPGVLMKEKLGTPAFMAPELHLLPKWSAGYDHAVDLWAAGCVMVFLLASEYAFIDEAGSIVLEELLRGDLPIWNRTAFGGLFDAGAYGKKPSNGARNLVQQLLAPISQYRISAGAALNNEWFRQLAVGFTPPRVGDVSPVVGAPLLRWEDFRGVPGVQDQMPARLFVDKLGFVLGGENTPRRPPPMFAQKHIGAPVSSFRQGMSPMSPGSPNLLQSMFHNGV